MCVCFTSLLFPSKSGRTLNANCPSGFYEFDFPPTI